MSKVVNLRHTSTYDVRIDRASRWGNPYTHRADVARKRGDVTLVATRDEAIAAYKRMLWADIQSGKVTLDDLAELHLKTLACWCHPQACHGDILVAASAWAYGELARADAEDGQHHMGDN